MRQWNSSNRRLFVFFWHDSPQGARASSFTKILDHTQRRTTVGRTPLDKWSPRRQDLYLTTHNTHNIQTSGGIRTRNLNRRAAADIWLRTRGHWGANRSNRMNTCPNAIPILPHPTNPTFNGPALNQTLRGERLQTNRLNHCRNHDLSTIQIQDPVPTSHETYCPSVI
jgi:hypothetical protein